MNTRNRLDDVEIHRRLVEAGERSMNGSPPAPKNWPN